MKFQNYFFFLLLFLCQSTLLLAQTQNVTYTESLEDIVNPDRGFYTPYNAYASDFDPLVLSDLQSKRTTTFTPWQGNYTVKTSVFFRQLLDAEYNTVERQVAFLDTNGNWRDTMGEEGVPFFTANAVDTYHIIIRHRNHVDIMSANALTLDNATPYDFTNPSNVRSGNLQLADLGGGQYGMCAGDVDGNGIVTVVDYNLYVSQISLMSEYLEGDLNMDGSVTVADYNLLKENISKMGVTWVRISL